MKPGVYEVRHVYPSRINPNGQTGDMTYRVTVHEDGSATNDLALGGFRPLVFDPPRPWGIGFANCRILPWVERSHQ